MHDEEYVVAPGSEEFTELIRAFSAGWEKENNPVTKPDAKQRYEDKRRRIYPTFLQEEYEWFCQQAEKRGKKPAAFLKELALRQLKKQNQYMPTAEELELRAEALRQVRGLANNYNQMTHLAHSNKRVDKKLLARQAEAIQKILAIIEDSFSPDMAARKNDS